MQAQEILIAFLADHDTESNIAPVPLLSQDLSKMTMERKEGKLLCQMLKEVLGEKVDNLDDNELLKLEHVLDYLRADPSETHLAIPYVSSYLFTDCDSALRNFRYPLLPFSPTETDNVVQALHSNLNCLLWPRFETSLLKRLVDTKSLITSEQTHQKHT